MIGKDMVPHHVYILVHGIPERKSIMMGFEGHDLNDIGRKVKV